MDYREFLDSVDRKAYHEGEWRWQEGEYNRHAHEPLVAAGLPQRLRRAALR